MKKAFKKSSKQPDSPQVIALPPLVYISGLIIGLLLHFITPISIIPKIIEMPLGIILMIIAICLMVFSMKSFGAAKTEVDPRKPTTAIVDFGPYRFSRNPIYLAMTLFYLGITIWVNSLTMLIMLLPVLIMIRFGVIEREEKYLERKFGKRYLKYKSKVRRWV